MNTNIRDLIERNRMSIKLVVIGFLTLLLLIPLGMVSRLINERKLTKENAVRYCIRTLMLMNPENLWVCPTLPREFSRRE